MFWHYLSVAVRNLARTPFHTVASVVGLALGLACFVGAYLFVAYVRSADRQYPAAERIYVMYERAVVEAMGLDLPFWSTTTPLLADRLRADFPELEEVARSRRVAEAVVDVGAELSFRNLAFVEPSFQRIFELALVHGTDGGSSTQARVALLTVETATALFGRTDVVGATLSVREVGDVPIVGVLARLPQPSHLSGAPAGQPLEGFIVTRVPEDLDEPLPEGIGDTIRWFGGGNVSTYVLLPENGSLTAAEINARMPEFVARHVTVDADIAFEARHVSAIVDDNLNDVLWSAFGPSVTGLLLTLGALVLGVACLNFVNLATARATTRATEVGLRKALGARRSQLVRQFLLETAAITVAAAILSLVLLQYAVAVANNTFSLTLSPPTAAYAGFWSALLAIVGFVIVAAGIYPAIVLGRAQPADTLRGGTLRGGSSALRALLTTCQFAVAGALLTAVAVVALQNAELKRASLALGPDPLVVIPTRLAAVNIDPEQFRVRLLESPHIKEVTGAYIAPWEMWVGGSGYSRTPGDVGSFQFIQNQVISFDYFETLATPVLAGREFSRAFADLPADDGGATIVIDRRAALQFGWSNPADAVGEAIYGAAIAGESTARTIIGVVEHAPPRFLGWQSSAFIYQLDPDGISLPIIRISAADVPAALAHIDSVWRSLSPTMPIKREFADERFARAYALFEHVNRTFIVLATIAIAISALGLFGMAAYVVGRRRREIGIRKAQGASMHRLFGMLLGQFLRPVLIGNLIAIPVAFIAARAYLGLFVKPIALTPGPFVASLAITLLVATLVVAHQVMSAVRVTPAGLLRRE